MIQSFFLNLQEIHIDFLAADLFKKVVLASTTCSKVSESIFLRLHYFFSLADLNTVLKLWTHIIEYRW